MLADFFPDKTHLPFRHGLKKADKRGIAAFRAAYHVVFIGINALENRTQIVVGPYQSCFPAFMVFAVIFSPQTGQS